MRRGDRADAAVGLKDSCVFYTTTTHVHVTSPHQMLGTLVQIGGCVRPDGICEFSSMFRLASEGDILRILRSMQIRDLRPRG